MCQATEADAVLLTEESVRRLLPDWLWLPVTEPAVELVTWLVWQPETRQVVERVAELVRGLDAEAS